jgi:ppGpp synthetase/RelA/SpoT-type nucleotidyltranferase
MSDAAVRAPDPFGNPEDPGFSRVPDFLWTYANDHSDLAEAAVDLRRFLADIATGASILVHTIESRAKKLSSYREKAAKRGDDGAPKYEDPASQIRDCVAARVILFTSRARNDFASVLENRVEVFERQNPGDLKHNGYDSDHFIITALRDDADRGRYSALTRYLTRYPGLEIQLRSVAAHAWAEYEHDVRYKSAAYAELSHDARAQVDQWFIEAGGLRRMMDGIFDQVQGLLYPESGEVAHEDVSDEEEVQTEVLEAPVAEPNARPLDVAVLADFFRVRYPDSKPGDAAEVVELLHHLAGMRIATVDDIETSLSDVEFGHVARLMDYPIDPSATRRLDDELLAALTDRYVDAATDEKRQQLLRLRLARVRGKFAIYGIYDGSRMRRPVSAAHAVRDLASLVARRGGLEAATVPGVITLDPGEILPSYGPRAIRTSEGVLYVVTNFTRDWAESVMGRLVAAAPGSGFRVLRAGDLICEAPEIGGVSPSNRHG